MTESNIRILLADDHAVLRAGLRALLDGQPDMEVVGEAADGQEALDKARALQPDVVLLDLTMPGVDGLEALRQIRDLSPSARVLVLTMHDDRRYLRQALNSGASGYVLKRAAEAELLSAIRAVQAGGTYLHPDHARAMLDGMVNKRRGGRESDDRYELLSPREREVLRLIALGHTNAQVGEMLFISTKTVETYKARLMQKLGLRGRAALVRYALQRGLLSEE